MSKQSLTAIRDYLAADRRCHDIADIIRATGLSSNTVSHACSILVDIEPGVIKVQRGVWQYREREPALDGPTGNGSADLATLRRTAAAQPAQLTLAPEDGSLWPDGEPMRRAPREPEADYGRQPFAPRYGPPFRVRLESAFRSRHGGNGYRFRTEDGRGGFLFWDDEAGE